MGYEDIEFSITGDIARLALNRPNKLNSLTASMHLEIRDALDQAEQEGARVLVLSGIGRAFCAGQDLGDRTVTPGERKVDLGVSLVRDYKPLVMKLRSLSMPTVAQVNGVAAGAGANIALACDIVIAGESASFIQSFSNIGLMPDSGGTWMLPRLVGLARASALAMLAERLTAQEAAHWGLIWSCVADKQLTTTVEQVAAKLAAGPTRAYTMTRQAMECSFTLTLEQQLDLEADFQRALGFSPDYAEGVAAFTEKRSPRFCGS